MPASASSSVTRMPLRARPSAVRNPTGPAPTTITSPTSSMRVLLGPLARQIGGDGLQLRVADLGLAHRWHDADAVAHCRHDEVRRQVAPLVEPRRRVAVVLGLQRVGAWPVATVAMAVPAEAMEDLL